MLRGLDQQMEKKEDGGLYFVDRIWVPLMGDVRTIIMDETHAMRYSIHPGADKMYYDLRHMYWWPGMKKDIATYVSRCLICSKVKLEHRRPLMVGMILSAVEKVTCLANNVQWMVQPDQKIYTDLTAAETIQVIVIIKAILNIILQALHIENLCSCSQHHVAMIFGIKSMLMQGTSLTKQERECKLYDEFYNLTYKTGGTLRDFYLRFSLLLNDMNIYNMKLEQFQVNTKSLNTLPPEWSKFVTDVKLVRDLHTTNIDQLHAYLRQHEFHPNESSQYESPHQSQQYPTHQSSTPLSITYPSIDYQSSVHHNFYSPSSSIPQLEYAPSINQQPEFSQPDLGLIVPVFHRGDDPIDVINHVMSFLTAVITSCYPTTNNQLRNSSNPRQQATINDGRVALQPIQGRQTSFTAGTTRTYTPGASRSNSGKQRTVICYNYKGEGHMSRQCTKPKRKWDDSWFKEKVLLV
ncbi:retrovirus-related pol polyprotein from transposon TNT 1-94 [Tanacetum coccineum]